jgi:2-polyprenyl-3-methyl-5-hydroxy-6-metoxy-1,4-benzoquinol methylase
MDLYNQKGSKAYYENAYTGDYMDEWEDDTKYRIIEVINGLNLSNEGTALDFGCGAGVLTDVIRQALPGYKVYGTDISENAINKAKIYYDKCTFFHDSDASHNKMKFDFIFTHHVLEHVYDIVEVADQIVSYLKPSSSMLHILPCGNENSLEYNICSLVKNGIDDQKGGRFYFEDKGHVRRLTTEH